MEPVLVFRFGSVQAGRTKMEALMRKSLPMRVALLLVSVLLLSAAPGSAFAQGGAAKTTTDDLLSSVVRIKTYINPDGRTIDNLGQERDGSTAGRRRAGCASGCSARRAAATAACGTRWA